MFVHRLRIVRTCPLHIIINMKEPQLRWGKPSEEACHVLTHLIFRNLYLNIQASEYNSVSSLNSVYVPVYK